MPKRNVASGVNDFGSKQFVDPCLTTTRFPHKILKEKSLKEYALWTSSKLNPRDKANYIHLAKNKTANLAASLKQQHLGRNLLN